MAKRQNLWPEGQPGTIQSAAEIVPAAQTIVKALVAGEAEIAVLGTTVKPQLFDASMCTLNEDGTPNWKESQVVAPASLRAIWLECRTPKNELRHISVLEVNREKYPNAPKDSFLATWVRDDTGSETKVGGRQDSDIRLGIFLADGKRIMGDSPVKKALGPQQFITPDYIPL